MKTSRDELKGIVRELLLELLSEGLGNAVPRPSATGRPAVPGTVREQRTANGRRAPAFDPRLDTPLVGGRQPTAALRETIKRESGGNPLMADLLADTAVTTLPAQLSHGDTGTPSPGAAPSGPSQQEQFHGAPEEVFGDSASRWADLAFMEPKKKTA